MAVQIFNPLSARTNFRRQNMTSIDVRFWRIKSIPTLKELNTYNGHGPIGIQMNRKELTRTILTILKRKKPFGLHGL